jgi:hypothetical protein
MRVQTSTVRTIGFVSLAALGAAHAEAQTSFNMAGREVQVHGFFQQGVTVSDGNPFLTMGMDNGSGEMTDGGANVSTKLHDNVSIGAQVDSQSIEANRSEVSPERGGILPPLSF